MATFVYTGFHNYSLIKELAWIGTGGWQTGFDYTFYNHFHPFVGELLDQLNRKSIDGLLDPAFQESLEQDFFKAAYRPVENDATVKVHSFPKVLELDVGGAYSVYNWELFFHVPLTIAVHLSKNQRFAEAQRWFHYIFDPTARDGRFWRFLAFRREESPLRIDALLRLISKPDDECTDAELAMKQLVLSGYEAMRQRPFQPHAIARTRFLAYQYCVVMKYLDNLIAWGDSLFRQDTMESVAEATQLYIMAANLLGPKPQRIPQRGRMQPKTFAQLRAAGLDPLGNALVELEGLFPFNLYSPVTAGVDTGEATPLFGIGRALYFCLPQNDKLLGYWDTVADRLF
ncbi:MAG TPA: toxin, partial [Limnochordia bacterium]